MEKVLMNAAHAEFRENLIDLGEHTLPSHVLAQIHAWRLVAHAASPLPESLKQAVAQCTTWQQLVSFVDNLEADA